MKKFSIDQVALLFIISIFLYGCAQTTPIQMEKATEGFILPGSSEKETGMATIYIARPSYLGAAAKFNIFADNAKRDSLELGYTKGMQHIWFNLNPGTHKILSVAENTATYETDFKPDSTYFFKQIPTPGFLFAGNQLIRTDSVEGRYFIKNTSLGTIKRKRLIVSDSLKFGADEFKQTGLQLIAGLRVGGLVGGLQKKTGLINEDGKTASVSKIGFDASLRFFPINTIGITVETGGIWGDAAAPNTKSMDYTSEWSSNLGLALSIWRNNLNIGLLQLLILGGVNYTRFSFAEEYEKFVESKEPVVFTNSAASGLGWYIDPEIQLIQKSGLITNLGIRYLETNPKFPNATKTLTGTNLMGSFAVGYRF